MYRIVSVVEQLLKAGRTPPDIVWTVAWGWLADLIKRGKLMRMNPLITKNILSLTRPASPCPAIGCRILIRLTPYGM